MDTEPGRSLILWTVRISVALYAAAVCLRFSQPSKTNARLHAYRVTWLLSWIFCVVHVICAFHFQHRWDHSAALEHTANMTHRVVGIHWGGGLYINYMFIGWWGANALNLLRRHDSLGGHQSESPQTDVAMHAVAAFMMFNATVVFGPRWWIIPAAALILLLTTQRIRDIGRHRRIES